MVDFLQRKVHSSWLKLKTYWTIKIKARTHGTVPFLAFKKSFSYHDLSHGVEHKALRMKRLPPKSLACAPTSKNTRNAESMDKVPHLSVAHASTSAAQAFGEAAESKGFPQRPTCAAWSNAHLKAFTAWYSFQGFKMSEKFNASFLELSDTWVMRALRNSQSRKKAKWWNDSWGILKVTLIKFTESIQ